MNVLLLAPHPFYQERGTPIAIDLLLRVLSERGDSVDIVTYHEGRPVDYPNVRIFRIPDLPWIRNVRPGFSIKKLVCDFFMMFKIMALLSKKRYEVVHSVEEAVFMAVLLRWFGGIPYIYDMDSSLPDQMVGAIPPLKRIRRGLDYFEGLAVRNSELIVPVCESLARVAEKRGAKRIVIVPDVALLGDGAPSRTSRLKQDLGIGGVLLMYVGNLEPYQGVDLLLESFAIASRVKEDANLVIIGGAAGHIKQYTEKCERLNLGGRVHFLGPKPLADLGGYLSEADILVSPRIKGANTPMKVYSYLQSGKAVLATDLVTHTQVLNREVAFLSAPDPVEFSRAMVELIEKPDMRRRLGEEGKRLIEKEFNFESFRSRVRRAYDMVESDLRGNGRGPQ